MLFTIGNKLHVNSIFEKSFDEASINYSRFSMQPTILNNLLWYGIAETPSDYRVGFYLLFDRKNIVDTV